MAKDFGDDIEHSFDVGDSRSWAQREKFTNLCEKYYLIFNCKENECTNLLWEIVITGHSQLSEHHRHALGIANVIETVSAVD